MILASLATKFLFARLASLAMKFVCETRKKRVLLRNCSFCDARKKRFLLLNFVTRLAFRKSRYKISVCETHEKWVSLLISTRESRENLARILSLKSESCFSREFQKVILVSTLVWTPGLVLYCVCSTVAVAVKPTKGRTDLMGFRFIKPRQLHQVWPTSTHRVPDYLTTTAYHVSCRISSYWNEEFRWRHVITSVKSFLTWWWGGGGYCIFSFRVGLQHRTDILRSLGSPPSLPSWIH
jgi:hypothetical protein